MPWFIYLALKQLFPTGTRFPVFFSISTLGVLLGVMVLTIVISVMNGFGDTYKEKIQETSGDLNIRANYPIFQHEAVERIAMEDADVVATETYAYGFVMAQHRNIPTFPQVQGIELDRENAVIDIEKFMLVGSVDDLYDDAILVSSRTAQRMGIYVGASVFVYTPLMIDRLENNEVMRPRELEVVGIFETGWETFDSNTLVGTIRLMQELYALDTAVHGIRIKLRDGVDEEEVRARLAGNLEAVAPSFIIETWKDQFADFLWVLELEKIMMFFLLLFISIVAGFAIGCVQFMMVMRRQREIGLISAIGAESHKILFSYIFQGLLIGTIGTMLGLLSAFLILYFRDPIIDVIADSTGSKETLIQFYQFYRLPVAYSLSDLTIICSAAILVTVIASVVPAIFASSLNTAEALRGE